MESKFSFFCSLFIFAEHVKRSQDENSIKVNLHWEPVVRSDWVHFVYREDRNVIMRANKTNSYAYRGNGNMK